MALTHIEYGALASSKVMNDNFEFLEKRIADIAGDLDNSKSGINSNIMSINGTISAQKEELIEQINELKTSTEEIKSKVNSINYNPDYNRGIGISLPYIVEQDGFVYAGVDGIDALRFVYVNGRPVHGHSGYSGGKHVYSGSTFPVSSGDYISCDLLKGFYYFYPQKGGK